MAIIQPELSAAWFFQLMIAGGLFVGLAGLVKYSPATTAFEQTWQKKIAINHDHWWWRIIACVFDPKALVVWDFILSGVLLFKGNIARAIWALLTLASCDLFGILVKHYVKRKRPDHRKQRASYSFPSGHTLGTTLMLLMGQMFWHSAWAILIYVLIWGLVVYCRLTLCAHYLTDVLAAVSLAYAWWIASEMIYILIMR